MEWSVENAAESFKQLDSNGFLHEYTMNHTMPNVRKASSKYRSTLIASQSSPVRTVINFNGPIPEIPPQDLVNPETWNLFSQVYVTLKALMRPGSDGRILKNSQKSRKFFGLPRLRLSVGSLRPVVATFSQRLPRPPKTTGLRWTNMSAFGTRLMTMWSSTSSFFLAFCS